MSNKALIVIPARFGSTRFPGKPLTLIAGKTMLQRVHEIAIEATKHIPQATVLIATDDERIFQAALKMCAQVVMTPEDCKTGSDRALAACNAFKEPVDYVVNLQGDAPLTPPHFISKILKALMENKAAQVTTPCVKLSWEELDQLKARKKTNPFSGTTLTMNAQGQAMWFSKQIIPSLRGEALLRENSEFSPVLGHVGLYAYTVEALKKFVSLPEGHYEKLEGLEQLRLLENNLPIHAVEVDYQGRPVMSGVDTEQDAKIAEALILKHGEPCHA